MSVVTKLTEFIAYIDSKILETTDNSQLNNLILLKSQASIALGDFSGGGSGGGSGASAAEIKTAIETAANLDNLEASLGGINGLTEGISDSFGAPSDVTAASDNGSFNLIQFIKRLLLVKLPATLGQKTSANSFPVVLPSDYSLSVSASANKYVSGSIPNTTIAVNILIKDAVDAYPSLTVQFSTITLGSVTFQGSNNNAIWENIQVYNIDTRSSVSSINTSNTMVYIPTVFQFVRLVFTPNISATASISAYDIALTNGELQTTNPFKVSTSGVVSVGTSSSIMLNSDPARKKLIITNPASNTGTIYLATSSNFSLSATNYMIALSPGDSFLDNENIMTDEIIGISTVAATLISITTWV